MRVLRKMSRFLDILATPKGYSGFVGPRPKSIASYLLAQQLRGEGIEFKTIIDGGANVGQFARAMTTVFPDAVIHSFEPSPETVQALRQNLRGLPQVTIHQKALGDEEGEVTFYCNSDSQTSSVLPLNERTGFHKGPQTLSSIQVPMAILQEVIGSPEIEQPILLKLDLQGYELAALKGAGDALRQCSHVLIESVFEEAYEGEPLFNDILGYMYSMGFAFYRPLDFLKDDQGRIVQMDALFRNTAL